MPPQKQQRPWPVAVQQRCCPPLRALLEAAKQADATPAGRALWPPTSDGNLVVALAREAPDGAAVDARPPPPGRPAGIQLWRDSGVREAGGAKSYAWHFAHVRRDAAAAEAYLRHKGDDLLLKTARGSQRRTAASLPPAPRRLFAELLRATGGTAAVSTAHGTAVVSGPNARHIPVASASVAFAAGDVVHLIFASVTHRETELDPLLCSALEYAAALAAALSQAHGAAAAAGGAGGEEQGEGQGQAAGIIGALSGALLGDIMDLTPPHPTYGGEGTMLEY